MLCFFSNLLCTSSLLIRRLLPKRLPSGLGRLLELLDFASACERGEAPRDERGEPLAGRLRPGDPE